MFLFLESLQEPSESCHLKMYPFQTTQGNRLSCRDQEGRRGSEEAVPGPSVFPSGEPGVSGDFWVHPCTLSFAWLRLSVSARPHTTRPVCIPHTHTHTHTLRRPLRLAASLSACTIPRHTPGTRIHTPPAPHGVHTRGIAGYSF